MPSGHYIRKPHSEKTKMKIKQTEIDKGVNRGRITWNFIDGRSRTPKPRKQKYQGVLLSHFVWCSQPENLKYVPKGFVVHHLDLNPDNNNCDNLFLMSDRSHRIYHNLIIKNYKEVILMASLKKEAQAYEPPQTLNIADLDKVPLSLELKEREGENSEGKTFSYKYIEIGGHEYRVPNSVIEQIQDILKIKPDVQSVKVNRSGSGLKTRYKTEVAE